ncbi:aminopeptidase N-like [Diaphorina citri]|uniref:Aminopeptidase N n=1 Tax=Diaphorina citri TaxID=121845 RepID=A0A3Q0IST3_DIACI|nr:aminopeptidase N-like [Diaphorina citri]
MIENVLTPTVFQNALQDYLRNGADLGGTVEPANLWDAFDEVLTEIGGAQYLPPNSTSITGFVDQWVNKPGFPLVTFSRNYSSKVVTVTQQRFLVEKADRDADKTNWTIPLTYTTKTNANFSSRANLFWFDRFKPSVQFSIPENNDWLIANLKEVGFYRVNYDAQNWALIAAQLSANPAQIHLLNRAQILDDAFTLARADLVPYEAALELTRYLKTEKDFIPWYAVWSHIRDLLHTYAQTEVANQMKTYFIDRLEGIFNELGLEDKSTEENMSKLGRSSISLWICNLGHSGCYNQAVAEFRTWIRAPEKSNIPPNIKDAVYCMGIKYGSGEEWTRLWQYYLTTDLASEKIAVMYALGCSQNETVLYDYLSKITDPKSGIRSQDHYIVIRGVLGERPGLRAGLKFLKDKTHSLLEEVKKDELSNAGENLKSIISTVGAGISSKDELNQFTSILTGYQSNPTIGASINKTLTHIQERFTRSANHQKALEKWFGANTPSTTPSPTTPSQSPLPTHPTSHPTHATTQKPSGATGLRQFAPSVMVATALVVLVRFGQS